MLRLSLVNELDGYSSRRIWMGRSDIYIWIGYKQVTTISDLKPNPYPGRQSPHPLSFLPLKANRNQTVFISGLRVSTSSEFEKKSSGVELEWWKTDRSFVAETGGIVDKQRHLVGEGEGSIASLLLFLLDSLSEKKMKASNVFLVSWPDFGYQLLYRKRKRHHLIWISTSIHHS